MPQLRVQDFSGGETDRYRDGGITFAQRMRNLLISENRRAISRPGYSGMYSSIDPFGTQKIEKIWNHRTPNKTSGAPDRLMKYETFILSNGAIRVQNNLDGGWRTVTAANGSTAFMTLTDQSYQGNYIRINDNEFLLTGADEPSAPNKYTIKFYREPAGEWEYVSLGLPKYAGATINPVLAVAGGNDWGYAFVLKHEYTLFETGAGNITKIVRSAPAFSDIITGVSITTITMPSFDASTLADYEDGDGVSVDTKSVFAFVAGSFNPVVWEIYRTLDKGSVYYHLFDVAATGGVFADSISDTVLSGNEKLYTTGGVLPNDMINDRPKFGTYANDTLWLASSSRVWQSKVGIYDATPGSFNFRVREGEEITAINTIDIYPIVFTTRGVYRIEGLVDDLGNGTHRVRTISETQGALSNATTVRTGDKIFFWSNDGIRMTNGYTAAKVSEHYNDTYDALVNRTAFITVSETPAPEMMRGVWDDINERVHWIIPKQGDFYNSDTLTLDVSYKHEEGYCLTSGDVPYEATSIASEEGDLHIVTSDGFVLSTDDTNTSDLDVDDTAETIGIAWDYISCSMSFGASLFRKWIPRILIHATNLSNLTFDVLSDTDESGDYRSHNPVRARGFTRGLYFLKRWFPKGRLRATYKTIRFTNSLDPLLFRSDDYVLADRNTGSITTVDASNWPTVSVGYEIAFGPTYTTKYRINTASGGDTLLIDGDAGIGSNSRWQITGIPTDETLELNGYTIDYFGTGEGHTQSGVEGAGNV